jgi:hypothetical protein
MVVEGFWPKLGCKVCIQLFQRSRSDFRFCLREALSYVFDILLNQSIFFMGLLSEGLYF